MFCQPCQGLRSCLLHHPPTVTFFICIVTLAAALLSLGAYLETHPVTDSDFTQDWDSFLHALSAKKICPPGHIPGQDGTVELSSHVETEERTANASVMATISVSPLQVVLNYSSLQITATGTQLGLRGVDADSPLTVSLTPDRSSGSRCNGSSTDCPLRYCLLITGPQHLLPYSRSSPQCVISDPIGPALPDLNIVEAELSNSTSCFSLAYEEQPDLKNILSEADIALCVQRLTYTGLAVLLLGLLLMVMVACCSPPIKDTRLSGPL